MGDGRVGGGVVGDGGVEEVGRAAGVDRARFSVGGVARDRRVVDPGGPVDFDEEPAAEPGRRVAGDRRPFDRDVGQIADEHAGPVGDVAAGDGDLADRVPGGVAGAVGLEVQDAVVAASVDRCSVAVDGGAVDQVEVAGLVVLAVAAAVGDGEGGVDALGDGDELDLVGGVRFVDGGSQGAVAEPVGDLTDAVAGVDVDTVRGGGDDQVLVRRLAGRSDLGGQQQQRQQGDAAAGETRGPSTQL